MRNKKASGKSRKPHERRTSGNSVKSRGRTWVVGAVMVVLLAVVGVLAVRSWQTEPLDHQRVEELLQKLYPQKRLPSRIPQEEKDLIDDANRDLRRKTSVYGELKLDGAQAMMANTDFANKTFIDLGGGRGMLAMYAGLRSRAKAAISIELSPTRHKVAQAAWRRLAALNLRGNPQKHIQFYQADILESGDKIRQADILYWCDTLFSKALREGLLAILEETEHEVHVFTLKRLPRHPRLRHLKTLHVGVSWRKEGAPMHHYVFLPSRSNLVGEQPFFPTTKEEAHYAIDSSIYYKAKAHIGEKEERAIRASGNSPEYETLSLQGVESLLTQLDIKNEDRVFILGSGMGKTAVVLYMRTLVQEVTGIEISPTRHRRSLRAKRKLFSEDWSHLEHDPDRTLRFIQGDFLQPDIDISSGTIFYACSKHFSPEILKGIVDRLAAIPREVTLVLFSKLPPDDRVRLIKTFQTSASWSKAADVFVYKTVFPSQK